MTGFFTVIGITQELLSVGRTIVLKLLVESFCLGGKDIENKSLKSIFFLKELLISDGVRLINTVANKHKLKQVRTVRFEALHIENRRLAFCFVLVNLR